MTHFNQHHNHLAGVTLILGGVRSGKSRFAQDLAEAVGGRDVLFVATAEVGDDEMLDRIQKHRQSRPSSWQTLECPLNIGQRLQDMKTRPRVILVDCLTMLVSNVMFQHSESGQDLENHVADEVKDLLKVTEGSSTHLLIVSGEVGSGVVPESAMGRRFRDLLGFANQQISASSVATYLMVSGLAIEAKRLASSVSSAAQNYQQMTGIDT